MSVPEPQGESSASLCIVDDSAALAPESSPVTIVRATLDAGVNSVQVVHAVAGRMRLRVPRLKHDYEWGRGLAASLASLQGVQSARVNGWAACVVVEFEPDLVSREAIVARIAGGIFPPAERAPGGGQLLKRLGALSRILLRTIERLAPPVVQFALGAAAFASCLLGGPPAIATGLTIAAAVPIVGRAARTALEERRLCVDGLDGMAAALMIIQGSNIAASFMTVLIGLGEFIRELTARRCKGMIGDLLGLAGRSAWLVKGRKRICVPAADVKVGDVVVIYPGEMIPVDGVVLKGEAAVSQASLTGESAPRDVGKGDPVHASSVVTEGKIYVLSQATGRDSRAGMLIDMVENAPLHETRMQNYASAVADRLVLPILLGAVASFAFTRQINRMMSVLIFDFSTGIRISAPTAVLASMHRAGRHGILIKSGAALEKLAEVNAIVFDKTGTLTTGEPVVTDVVSLNGVPADMLLALAAAVEERSRHPAARAIVRHARKRQVPIPERTGSHHRLGLGAGAIVEGVSVAVGSKRLMLAERVDVTEAADVERRVLARGESIAYVSLDGKLGGVVAYTDRLRPEVPEVIAMLRRRGVNTIVMATGDHEISATAVAGITGIKTVLSGAFPEQKAELVRTLKAQGLTVAVVGDGINDSPALVHADVGISLHGGTDAAREHADVVLTDDNLLRLPEAIDIARSAMSLVRQNVTCVAIPNGVGLALAGAGAIGPAVSTLLNNGSAILTALNSLRPLFSNDWSRTDEAAER